ncbi:hypothetical protein B7486_57540 [cyanobacterium TDX16]|nr:hypothetical protein B7486_57540 [cyanobacterium TDX16]
MAEPSPPTALADTTREVHRRQVARWQEMRSQDKAALVDALTQDCTALALAGIRRRGSTSPDEELRLLVARSYGVAFADEVYGAT